MGTLGAALSRRASAESTASGQVAGGVAALVAGAVQAYMIVLFIAVLPALGFQESYFTEPSSFLRFVIQHQSLYLVSGVLMVLASLASVVAVRAIGKRLEGVEPAVVGTATVFGYIGCGMLLLNAVFQYAEFRRMVSDATAFAEQAIPFGTVMFDLTNMSASLTLALWIGLISWAVVRRGGLPRALGYLGIATAIAKLPVLVGVEFGTILQVVWFLAVGLVLISSSPSAVGTDVD